MLADCLGLVVYHAGMWFRRARFVLVALVLLAPVPALVAPFVSAQPVDWAYRAYHPGLYRYPVAARGRLVAEEERMARCPRWVQSFELLAVMVREW